EDASAAAPRVRGQLLGQAALADTGLAQEEEEAAAPGAGVVEPRYELGELRIAADEDPSFRLVRRLGAGRQDDAGVLLQDRLVEVAELPAGLDTELLHQRRPSRLVDLECLGLAPGAVQGEHQLSPQALAERMLLDHPLDLADQLGVAAEGEIGGEAILDRGET